MAANNPKIVTGEPPKAPGDVVIDAGLISHFSEQSVSISLKYYQKKAECWSDWAAKELKAFTKIIDLLRAQTSNDLKGRGGSGTPACKDHKGSPKTSGFTRPDISDDIPFYEIYVNDKARIHGFFVESVFFLVWLDRSHRAFP